MTLHQYNRIKLLYNGIVAVEFENKTNYKIGDIYYHSPTIKSIVRKVNFHKDYTGRKTLIITELL